MSFEPHFGHTRSSFLSSLGTNFSNRVEQVRQVRSYDGI